jgi:4-hydroxybenzoate polyprenyltransferase
MIFAGVFLASSHLPSFRLIVLILLAATGARTTALAINRIVDRHIDKKNPRTANRELPSGKMSLGQATGILVVSLMLYFSSAWLISRFCFSLSLIPLVVFTVYPYMKRFTPFAHFGVGFGLAMAPLGGWFAVRNSAEGMLGGLLLAVFVVFWATGFDIIYSTLDEAFDKGEHLYSFTSRFGRLRALQISAVLHFISFCVLAAVFLLQLHTATSFPFLLCSGALLYLEQKKATDVELAFFRMNVLVGFSVLAMVLTGVFFS